MNTDNFEVRPKNLNSLEKEISLQLRKNKLFLIPFIIITASGIISYMLFENYYLYESIGISHRDLSILIVTVSFAISTILFFKRNTYKKEIQERKHIANNLAKRYTEEASENLSTCSYVIKETIPLLRKSIKNEIELAENHFKENQYSLFWDSIDKIMEKIEKSEHYTKKIQNLKHDYEGILAGENHNFPPHISKEVTIPTLENLSLKTESIIKIAKSNFEFASIWEQRKNNLIKDDSKEKDDSLEIKTEPVDYSSSILDRLWDGKESLAIAYWLYGVLIGNIVIIASFIIVSGVTGSRTLAIIPGIAYAIWVTIVIWRCAPNVIWQGWTYIARFLSIIGLLSLFSIFGK